MSRMATNFKLGLFTVLALVAIVAALFGLGIRGMRSDTVDYHSYFDESVQGLEIGSPVKYRGVTIGTVGGIGIASDNRYVDVTLRIDRHEAHKLKVREVAPNLRAQLGAQGITGVKFVNIDFFDPKVVPPPELSFPHDDHYIPAAPSLMKGLEDSVTELLQKLPGLVAVTIATLDKIQLMIADFQEERIPHRLGKAIDSVTSTVADLHLLLAHVDQARIPDKTAKAIENLDTTVSHVNTLLATVGGDGGLIASTKRTSDTIGDLGRSTQGSAEELERTLRDLDEAVQAIRDLAIAIERDPDMLVKGRSKEKLP